jgi:hypothetical protein
MNGLIKVMDADDREVWIQIRHIATITLMEDISNRYQTKILLSGVPVDYESVVYSKTTTKEILQRIAAVIDGKALRV